MKREQEIMKAITSNNIIPRIQEMMEEDIREAETKRIKNQLKGGK